ncbi:hypothetical protein BD324DRAFT_123450 [Kockovaella imperatae]|uniref:DUF962 domain protein n=1 Tax=Kockovaella imperatae TaxID=4999 RepID=A0A1Y1U9C1_9TREE|nr:hypothetical protein BD324DRAFT_123450 [Kockovaella imperatae]ORX34631.1 hypothetical protein BD324DRAFT_123450 [Kockovaella imperatae]
MPTPHKLRSQGPAEDIDLDHPHGRDTEGSMFDIEYQMVQYGSYHHTTGNRLIHHVCVPAICWATLLMLAPLKVPGYSVTVLAKGFAFQPSFSLFLATFYQVFYFILEPTAAAAMMGLVALEYLTATYCYAFTPSWIPFQSSFNGSAVPFGVFVFVVGFLIQFVGHGVFEKRKPRLMDNLFQAFIAAPFFVWLELLFIFFNYRPELQAKLESKVETELRKLNSAKNK